MALGPPRASPAVRHNWTRLDLAVGLVLVGAIAVVFHAVGGHDFVNFDDPDYVGENPVVMGGLTWSGVVWALTSTESGNWFPLTWWSHMLDVTFFGLDAGRHHLTSVVWHGVSTLVLFALLVRTTGLRGPSAFVALVFAIHPLHVESVAWLAERKDVIAGCLGLLTLWTYVRYVEQPGTRRFAVVVLCFCLAAMSKAMVVTLPFVMLLMDVWPLGRRTWLIREKAALFAVAAAAAIIAFVAQRRAGAVATLDVLPFGVRMANAIVSYATYLGQAVWPAGLAFLYPHARELSGGLVTGSAALLAAISFIAIRLRRSQPFVLVGWLWFLGMLVPVIGLVQIGSQAHADRYTYLPLVGVSIAVAFGLEAIVRRRPAIRIAMWCLVGAACVALVVVASNQVRHWRDSVALNTRAIAVTRDNYLAHNNLGLALRGRGELDEAIAHYREAARLHPRYADAQNNLGGALLAKGRPADALAPLAAAIEADPTLPESFINLGSALDRLGQDADATAAYSQALKIDPRSAGARQGLKQTRLRRGNQLAAQGRFSDAAVEFADAVRLDPDDVKARTNLGAALASAGRYDEAIVQFEDVLRRDPSLTEVRLNLDRAKALKAGRK